MANSSRKVVLITGGAKRIGAQVVKALHADGFNVVLHYRNSKTEALTLQAALNSIRADSVQTLCCELNQNKQLPQFIVNAVKFWGRLDVLVNNASSFYPTPLAQATENEWDDLMGNNLKAPFFLAQAAEPYLAKQHGCIINITDIHAQQPLKDYPIYTVAKAGLEMLTKCLARELGPNIRVNAIAPGMILFPTQENELSPSTKETLIKRCALKRRGDPMDIANAALYLINKAEYTTGATITVDGGRLLHG